MSATRTRNFAMTWENMTEADHAKVTNMISNKKTYPCSRVSIYNAESLIRLYVECKNGCTQTAMSKRFVKAGMSAPAFDNNLKEFKSALYEDEDSIGHDKLKAHSNSGDKSGRYRNWVMTFNNYTDEDYENIVEFIDTSPTYTYAIIAKEVAASGTPHLQMYLESTKQMTYTAFIAEFPGCNVEHRKGTGKQASDYCKKEKNYIELGVMKNPGKRTDLQKVTEAWEQTGSLGEAIKVATTLQSIQILKARVVYTEAERNWRPRVIWIWGPTACGKTYTARKECEGTRTFMHSSTNLKFWNNYDGHDNVIIDEFRASKMPLANLLTLLDDAPYQVEIKGGFRQFLAKTIYITCPTNPRDTYSLANKTQDKKDGNIDQLVRRCDEIRHMNIRHESTLNRTKWTSVAADGHVYNMQDPGNLPHEEAFNVSKWLEEGKLEELSDEEFSDEEL